jgi:hypothetical protein
VLLLSPNKSERFFSFLKAEKLLNMENKSVSSVAASSFLSSPKKLASSDDFNFNKTKRFSIGGHSRSQSSPNVTTEMEISPFQFLFKMVRFLQARGNFIPREFKRIKFKDFRLNSFFLRRHSTLLN